MKMSKIKEIKLDSKGIGLIEVIAAVAISVIVITALVSLALYTLRSATNSRMLLEGTKLANTQMELVRAVRDLTQDWGDFAMIDDNANCGLNPCHIDITQLSASNLDDATKMYNLVVLPGVEQFQISIPNSNENAIVEVGFTASESDGIIRVIVTANWNAGQVQETILQSDFSNWRNR
jgi:type II secretory pathway pseudopilin PulG